MECVSIDWILANGYKLTSCPPIWSLFYTWILIQVKNGVLQDVVLHGNERLRNRTCKSLVNVSHIYCSNAVLTSISEAAMDDHILSIVSEVLFDKTVVNESDVG